MGISYREQLGDNRPYWKVIVSLAFSLVGTILFVWIGLELLLYFMPFVIGWFIAYIVSPVVNWLERRLKIVKKLSSALVIILVLAAVVLLLYWAGSNLFREVAALFDDMPLLYRELSAGLRLDRREPGRSVFVCCPRACRKAGIPLWKTWDSRRGTDPEPERATVIAAGISRNRFHRS